MNMLEFMDKYGNAIMDKTLSKMAPVYNPEKPDELDYNNLEKLISMPRQLFKAQAECVLAISKAFYKFGRKSSFLCGEMGTGKTLMGASVAYLIPKKNKRIIVVCPPHLVNKWAREILYADRDAKIKIITKLSDVTFGKPVGSEYWILSREKAKLHYKDVLCYESENYLQSKERVIKKRFYRYLSEESIKFHLPFEAHENLEPEEKTEYFKFHTARSLELSGMDKYKLAVQYFNQTEPFLDYEHEAAWKLIEALKQARDRLTDKCPSCGNRLSPLTIDSKKICTACKQKLYGSSNKGFKRYAIAEYIKRNKKRCYLDLFIADEVHELKGGDTAQGQVLHSIAVSSKKTLALSGTLMGGYASNLYHLLYRLFTTKMSIFGYRYNSSMEFSKEYGVIEEIIERKITSGRTASINKSAATRQIVEKPGISPLILPNFILEDTVFIGITDIAAEAMPTYDEYVETIDMTQEQYDIYKNFEITLTIIAQKYLEKGNMKLLGALVNSLFALPDGARRGEIVLDPTTKDVLVSAKPLDLPLAPKEERLLEIIHQEKSEGRRCAIFLEHTGTRDLIPELTDRLKSEGIKPLILRSNTTTTDKREAWILDRVKSDNPDVLICNPNLVKTGLDLLDFPTIIYFQTGYSIYTLRQSSRRSWRIGQTKPVRVYYLVYAETAQERGMRLIATKLETSNVIEGRLSADGLSAMSEGTNSLVYDIARSMIEGKDEKKSMKDVWNSYQANNQFSSDKMPEKLEIIKKGDWEEAKQAQIIELTEDLQKIEDLWATKAKKNKDGHKTISVFDILEAMEDIA